MDKIDRHILRVLQQQGRISNADLAERVNLSPTPCLRRVRRLEETGVIARYVAELDRKQLGLNVSAYVFVRLQRNSSVNAEKFESMISELEQVEECSVLSGEYDYLVKVVATDLEHYEAFIKQRLAAIEQVDTINSTIVLKQVTSRHPLPV
ncbi:MAG: AsnC family transcriptional regulator [Cellvibrionaceae bacterium]|nr:AsnC family transcriptional regulator [Cellvibrionaceae bacterium]